MRELKKSTSVVRLSETHDARIPFAVMQTSKQILLINMPTVNRKNVRFIN